MSGTKDDSSGAGLKAGSQAVALVGTIAEAEGTSTADGPISDAAIAASGSDVLRHEQERDSRVELDFDRE